MFILIKNKEINKPHPEKINPNIICFILSHSLGLGQDYWVTQKHRAHTHAQEFPILLK